MSEQLAEHEETQEPGGEPEPEQEPEHEPEPDAEPEPEQEPEPIAQQEPSQSPEMLEKRAKTLEQAFSRYAAKVSDLYEEEATRLLPCPLCPDQHKGFVHIDFAGRVPEEVVQTVKLYLGIAREQDYAASSLHHTCEQCQGKGKVKTGSTVPGHETIPCPDCKGYGYMPPPNVNQASVVKLVPEQAQETNDQALLNPDDVDEWSEPRILPDGRENPNFGRMPNRKVLVEPYGVTAGLTAVSA